MIGMDSYLNAYVDRRMKYIVDEWDLATKADLSDFAEPARGTGTGNPPAESVRAGSCGQIDRARNPCR